MSPTHAALVAIETRLRAVQNCGARHCVDCDEQLRLCIDQLAAILASPEARDWQPIETAPRDSTSVLVAWTTHEGVARVQEAWWAIPYEAAPLDKGWWQTMTGALLSMDVHGLGATHWKSLPPPPTEGEQP